MQYSVETVENLVRKIKVEIPSDDLISKIEKRINKLSKEVKLPGFRPGKVPLKVVKERYGNQVRSEVLNEVINHSFQQAVQEARLNPANSPIIESIDDQNTKTLSYTATFEVMPTITLSDMTQCVFEKKTAEISEKDVEHALEQLRKQQAKWENMNEPAKEGLKVKINFEGFINGEKFEGGSGENVTFVLGEGKMLKEFEEGLKGMRSGENKEISIQFPENYHKDLSLKKALFNIQMIEIQSPILPEVDSDFAKLFNIKNGDVASLKEAIRKNLQSDLNRRIRSNLTGQVFEKLIEINEIDIPQSLVKDEIAKLRAQDPKHSHKSHTCTPEEHEKNFPDKLYLEQARKNVLLMLLIYEYIKTHEIKVDNEKLSERVNEIASAYENPEAISQWIYSKKDQLARLEAMVIEEQVVDDILNHSKIQEIKLSYNEIIKGN